MWITGPELEKASSTNFAEPNFLESPPNQSCFPPHFYQIVHHFKKKSPNFTKCQQFLQILTQKLQISQHFYQISYLCSFVTISNYCNLCVFPVKSVLQKVMVDKQTAFSNSVLVQTECCIYFSLSWGNQVPWRLWPPLKFSDYLKLLKVFCISFRFACASLVWLLHCNLLILL